MPKQQERLPCYKFPKNRRTIAGPHNSKILGERQIHVNRATFTLPIPDDELLIVTDGLAKQHELSAILYITRDNKYTFLDSSGQNFVNGNLLGYRVISRISISNAVKHFSPCINQPMTNTCVLTDNKPCVQAYEKSCRSEFSANPEFQHTATST